MITPQHLQFTNTSPATLRITTSGSFIEALHIVRLSSSPYHRSKQKQFRRHDYRTRNANKSDCARVCDTQYKGSLFDLSSLSSRHRLSKLRRASPK